MERVRSQPYAQFRLQEASHGLQNPPEDPSRIILGAAPSDFERLLSLLADGHSRKISRIELYMSFRSMKGAVVYADSHSGEVDMYLRSVHFDEEGSGRKLGLLLLAEVSVPGEITSSILKRTARSDAYTILLSRERVVDKIDSPLKGYVELGTSDDGWMDVSPPTSYLF